MSVKRFEKAQQRDYETALTEIRSGQKRSHWMWYIFPQLKGLGRSPTAQYYGIADQQEAREFLNHPVLGAHLREISQALLELTTSDANEVFGFPDNLKLCSSMTLFAKISGEENSVFHQVLDKYFGGKWDDQTLRLL